jgi:sterol desaturase/sphingolipid hydroxylase (fatty acid hydroxylase superfamily)
MEMERLVGAVAAAFAVFVASDLVYTLDHYFVHHDRDRYREGHARHHRRYNGAKDAAQLDDYELQTYVSASVLSMAALSVLSLLTGNIGFFLGAAFKLVHSLLFHLYQHRWWGAVPLRRQELGTPRRGWGLASARYHAFHHSHPNDEPFTYSETWTGFDRILEWAHPVLVRFTADARSGGLRAMPPKRA